MRYVLALIIYVIGSPLSLYLLARGLGLKIEDPTMFWSGVAVAVVGGTLVHYLGRDK